MFCTILLSRRKITFPKEPSLFTPITWNLLQGSILNSPCFCFQILTVSAASTRQCSLLSSREIIFQTFHHLFWTFKPRSIGDLSCDLQPKDFKCSLLAFYRFSKSFQNLVIWALSDWWYWYILSLISSCYWCWCNYAPFTKWIHETFKHLV